ncbi:MAG: glycosyltransferase [Alphaproteobacteria bacterium]
MAQKGWGIDVVANKPGSISEAVNDDAFAARYAEFYRIHEVGTRDYTTRTKSTSARVISRVKGYVIPKYDDLVADWRADAEAKALGLIRQHSPDALVTFAQPWVDHLIGLRVKARCRTLPWVAHFSDPWVDSLYSQGEDKRLLRMWRRQEKSVVKAADVLVFVTERTADLVMKKYPAEWRKKVYVVPHGYDLDLLRDLPQEPPTTFKHRCQFVYTGNFYGERNPLPLLRALGKIRRERPQFILPNFRFVGRSASEYAARAHELGIEDLVEFAPSVGYLDALNAAANADVLLSLDADTENSVFFPSKLVDYLMFGKPILAVTPPNGAAADILRPLGHFSVAPSDVDAIAKAIIAMLDQWDNAGWAFRPPAEYDIAKTADKFVGAVEAAIECAAANRRWPK